MNALFEQIELDAEQFKYLNRSYSDHFGGYYHYHQCCELLFVHQGKGNVIVNQRTYEMKKGMLFLFQPFQLHRIHADVSSQYPYERTIIKFDPSIINHRMIAFPHLQHYFEYLWQYQLENQAFDMNNTYSFIIKLLASFAQVDKTGTSQEIQEKKLLNFIQLISCMRDIQKETNQLMSAPITSRTHRYSEMIMQWIEKHYMDEFNLERLAEELHLSKFYVSRIFRKETGSSIIDYLRARRINLACRLLETTAFPIEKVGDEVGIPNSSYFCQLFKKATGISPLQYRISRVKTSTESVR